MMTLNQPKMIAVFWLLAALLFGGLAVLPFFSADFTAGPENLLTFFWLGLLLPAAWLVPYFSRDRSRDGYGAGRLFSIALTLWAGLSFGTLGLLRWSSPAPLPFLVELSQKQQQTTLIGLVVLGLAGCAVYLWWIQTDQMDEVLLTIRPRHNRLPRLCPNCGVTMPDNEQPCTLCHGLELRSAHFHYLEPLIPKAKRVFFQFEPGRWTRKFGRDHQLALTGHAHLDSRVDGRIVNQLNMVSNYQADFTLDIGSGEVTIVNRSKSTQIYINGTEAGIETKIVPGDILQIGTVEFLFGNREIQPIVTHLLHKPIGSEPPFTFPLVFHQQKVVHLIGRGEVWDVPEDPHRDEPIDTRLPNHWRHHSNNHAKIVYLHHEDRFLIRNYASHPNGVKIAGEPLSQGGADILEDKTEIDLVNQRFEFLISRYEFNPES